MSVTDSARGRALIVYAHPEPTSFTGAMKDEAVDALVGAGWAVDVEDLYGIGFAPTAGRHDFVSVADPSAFHYQAEQRHAWEVGGYSPEIVRAQQRVAESDAFVIIFPLWWGGMPAILKGWFERVLSYGFAYEDGRRYETGYFQGRRALLGITTGGTRERFSAQGSYGSMEQVLWATQHCMLDYMGLRCRDPFVAYATPRVSADERRGYLKAWADEVRALVEGFDVSSVPPIGHGGGMVAGSSSSWSSA